MTKAEPPFNDQSQFRSNIDPNLLFRKFDVNSLNFPAYQELDSDEIVNFTLALYEDGFKDTDRQFSISRAANLSYRGYDIVLPRTSERWYITVNSNLETEQMVAKTLGDHAILEREANTPDLAIYPLPRGSRSLYQTLKSRPFAQPYMQSLAVRTGVLLSNLQKLDSDGYGIDVDAIALTHNGDNEVNNDDTYLTIIPPLNPYKNPHAKTSRIKQNAQLEKDVLAALKQNDPELAPFRSGFFNLLASLAQEETE